jgi:two-component system nitrate/nitrite response regulator NarL
MSVSAPSAPVRVLVVDAQPLYLDALARMIRQCSSLQLVGEVSDGWTALTRIRAERPDIAIVAVELPGLDGRGLLRAVVRDRSSTRVLVLGEGGASTAPYEAIAGGAAGYLSKAATASQLDDAVRRVARGEVVIAPEALGAVAAGIRMREGDAATLLTRREQEVLALVAQGLSAPEIGSSLHLGSATVKTHMRHLYGKLGVSDRAAAVAQGMRRGLLE